MYIGSSALDGSPCGKLVEVALDGVVTDTPTPSAVRLLRWKGGVFTIAFDGEPLPVGPFVELGEPSNLAGAKDDPHPALYRCFMHLGAAPRSLAFAGAILNALCERLVVSTVSGGERYRVVFSRGMLVSLLAKAPCDEPLGTAWLTFLPDMSVVDGSVSATQGDEIVKRVAAGRLSITYQDRSSEEADWF
jgi:hypothetical protein